MATSGTNVFENSFPIDEIFEEAYERVGLRDVSGYHLTSARRSLNIMLQEWANRGLHYWEIDETNIDLVEGQAEYHFFRSAADDTSDSNRAQATTNQTASTIFGIDDVLEATHRTNRTQTSQQDVAMTKINRSTYQGLSNKYSAIEPPTWSLLLAKSCQSQGFTSEILDCNAENLTNENILKRVNKSNPRLIFLLKFN